MCNQEKMSKTELSIPKMLLLGFAPGLVVLFVAIIFSSPFFGIELNLLLSGVLAMLFGHIITELGILKFIAYKENKKIKDIIFYKNKTPIKRMFIYVTISLIIALTAFILLSQYELKIWERFIIFPDWFRMDKIDFSEIKYLRTSIILYFLLNGFIVPFIEEIYFRGYLLPRMDRFGKASPIINVLIFSIYHFFSPFELITRIVALTPYTYSVWKNRDIKIGILVHCLMNILGGIGLIMLLL